MEEVRREESEMKAIEEVEERERKEQEQKYSKDGEPSKEEAEQLQKEVKKKNEQSMMDWATSKLRLDSDKVDSLLGRFTPEQKPKTPGSTSEEKDKAVDANKLAAQVI